MSADAPSAVDLLVLEAVKRFNEQGVRFDNTDATWVLTGKKTQSNEASGVFSRLYWAGLVHAGHGTGWKAGPYPGRPERSQP